MTIFQEKLKSVYDRIWLNYFKKGEYGETVRSRIAERSGYYDIIQRYADRMNAPIVLELGCGTGIDINLIKKRSEDVTAIGADISMNSIQVALRVCAEFGNSVAFFMGDTLSLPLNTGTMDMLFSQGLVEHFENPIEVIREQVRVLRAGGILIVNVPQKHTGYTVMKRRLMRQGKWHLGWETEFSYRDLRQIGQNLGLIEKDVFGSQYWKSWREPAFVLRDLLDKFQRRNPFKALRLFSELTMRYSSIWKGLEGRWGHCFMQNIVIVFQKGADEDP